MELPSCNIDKEVLELYSNKNQTVVKELLDTEIDYASDLDALKQSLSYIHLEFRSVSVALKVEDILIDLASVQEICRMFISELRKKGLVIAFRNFLLSSGSIRHFANNATDFQRRVSLQSKKRKIAVAMSKFQEQHKDFASRLFIPLQRIMRYRQFFERLCGCDEESSDNKSAFQDLMNGHDKMMKDIERSTADAENRRKILEIQGKVDGMDVVAPWRRFLDEFALVEVDESGTKTMEQQARVLYLFNDILICCVKTPTRYALFRDKVVNTGQWKNNLKDVLDEGKNVAIEELVNVVKENKDKVKASLQKWKEEQKGLPSFLRGVSDPEFTEESACKREYTVEHTFNLNDTKVEYSAEKGTLTISIKQQEAVFTWKDHETLKICCEKIADAKGKAAVRRSTLALTKRTGTSRTDRRSSSSSSRSSSETEMEDEPPSSQKRSRKSTLKADFDYNAKRARPSLSPIKQIITTENLRQMLSPAKAPRKPKIAIFQPIQSSPENERVKVTPRSVKSRSRTPRKSSNGLDPSPHTLLARRRSYDARQLQLLNNGDSLSSSSSLDQVMDAENVDGASEETPKKTRKEPQWFERPAAHVPAEKPAGKTWLHSTWGGITDTYKTAKSKIANWFQRKM